MKLEPETLAKVLMSLTNLQDVEIGCEDCFIEIDQFAEMLRKGKDPAKVMPLVQHHLDLCQCCHEEFEALILALDAQDFEENPE